MPGCARPGAGAAPPVPMARGLVLVWDWAHWGQRGAGLSPHSLGSALFLNLGSHQRCWWLPSCAVWDVDMGLVLLLLPAAIPSSRGGPRELRAGPGAAKDPKKPKNSHARSNRPFEPAGLTQAVLPCSSISLGGCQPAPGAAPSAAESLGGSSPATPRGDTGRERGRGCRNEQSHGAAET